MKEFRVYNSIQQLKERGFKKASVATQFKINRRTVDRYWTMTVDEYEAQVQLLKRACLGCLPGLNSSLATAVPSHNSLAGL